MSLERIRRRRQALDLLEKLKGQERHVLVVHYSCESFYDRSDGSSPRVTSIAVRNWGTGQTKSFSIHQAAEVQGIAAASITPSYDDCERLMLDKFFDYAEKQGQSTWVHWNMRDANYGFEAIAHRRLVLGKGKGKKPQEPRALPIADGQRLDLARALYDIHGPGYVQNPKLTALVKKNNITARDFLNGDEEAAAFVAGEYVKLHQSTLRKVEVLATLLDRSLDGSLKTETNLRMALGGWSSLGLYLIKEHWIASVLATVGTVLGIIQFFA